MQTLSRLAALSAAQKWVQHLADNWSGPDDGHLHHDVVEALGAQARQTGHLRAAFHLKEADGVGVLQRLVDQRVVLWEMREVHSLRVRGADEIDGLFEHSHHAEPQ